jgi:tetratricopeptide (TPR) repeat protein/TolB-like protein
MVCPSCGAPNPEQSKACSQCGRGLTAGDDQTVYLPDSSTPPPAVPSLVTAPSAATPQPAMTWGSLPSQAVALPAAIPAGAMFGRYRIESLLGEGGMGAVYRAFDTELERMVALKLVRPELAISEQTMRRFKQELLLASRISHKNILRIHDLGDAGGIKFITMAFVEGHDLAHLLDDVDALPLDRALRFSRQLFAALEAAHDEGVVHRDLKPQNVLVDAADNLFVSDFGLAKSLEAEISMGTRTGQILGTPRYMSPEQVEAKDVDHRSDLYSAGLILYEMVTGELPFRGESAMQLMYQRVSEPPRDPRRARAGLPDYLANIILKCLEKDPAKRYQSAREVLADLQAQNAPLVSNAGGKTISIQLRKPSRRGTVVALSTVAVVLAALAAIPETRNGIRGMFGGGSAVAPKLYVAVVPTIVGGDPGELKYLADGVGDSLVGKLSGLRNVYVADANVVGAAPAAVRQDDGKLADLVGVKVVIRMAIAATGDRISVTVNGQDVEHRKTLLTRPFEGVKQDLLTLQDRIFDAVAEALTIRQSDEERAKTAARPTSDINAYDLYLRGASQLKGKRDRATATAALQLFEDATKADPNFALAYAGIADASVLLFRATKEESRIQQAVSAAELAERLNPNLPAVQIALGTAYENTGRTAEAMAKFKRALQLAPNSDEGYRRLGRSLGAAGRVDESIAMFKEAVRINPYYWSNHNGLANAYRKAGDHENEIREFQEVVRLKPDTGNNNLGAAYFSADRWEEAVPAFQKAVALDPGMNYNLGVAQFYLGKHQEAAQAFEAVLANDPDHANAALSLADTYRWSGQLEKAAAMYDRARAAALKAQKAKPNDAEALSILAVCAAQKNQPAEALRYIRDARTIDKESADYMFREALIEAIAQRWTEALGSLREALQSGYSLRIAQTEPELKDLRAKPEFARVIEALSKRSAK